MTIKTLATSIVLAFVTPFAAVAYQQKGEWELVRSVSNPYGGTMDYVLIPESKQRDFEYYEKVAAKVRGNRLECTIFFWTNRAYIPTSYSFEGVSMQKLTCQYSRQANALKPIARLACWLYATKQEGEKAQCFYMPGAPTPPSKW